MRLVTALLDLTGHKGEANKLRVGFRQWNEANSAKNDLHIWFRCEEARVGRMNKGGSMYVSSHSFCILALSTCTNPPPPPPSVLFRLCLALEAALSPGWFPLSHMCPPSPRSADATLALEAALSPGEAADFSVLWRGDWRQYAHVYMSEIVRRHMGGKRK